VILTKKRNSSFEGGGEKKTPRPLHEEKKGSLSLAKKNALTRGGGGDARFQKLAKKQKFFFLDRGKNGGQWEGEKKGAPRSGVLRGGGGVPVLFSFAKGWEFVCSKKGGKKNEI